MNKKSRIPGTLLPRTLACGVTLLAGLSSSACNQTALIGDEDPIIPAGTGGSTVPDPPAGAGGSGGGTGMGTTVGSGGSTVTTQITTNATMDCAPITTKP